MENDDDIDLSTFIERPSYARAISMEMSKLHKGEGEFEKKKKCKKRRQKLSEELQKAEADIQKLDDHSDLSDVSDVSEYFSAEEEVDSTDDSSTGSNERPEQYIMSSSELSSYSDDEICYEAHKKKRRPSKNKKKMQRQLKKKILCDFFFPFQDVENIKFQPKDFAEDIEDSGCFIQKYIPSLKELCIKCTLKKSSALSVKLYSMLPNRLKEEVTLFKKSRLLTSLQYSWLRRLLYYCEQQDLSYFYADCNSGECESRNRNVWSLYSTDKNSGHSCTKWLPHAAHTFCLQPTELWEKEMFHSHLLNVHAVLCSMINLMWKLLKAPSHQSKEHLQNIERIIENIRQMLHRRFPRVVEKFFDDVIPYVLWANGIKQAGQYFVQAADKSVSDNDRVLFLSEAARFYTQINDIALARKLHNETCDILLSTTPRQNENYHQIKSQMLMLLANIHDQGPMSSGKAQKSFDSWRSLFKLHLTQEVSPKHEVPSSTWIEAVEAVLCYHSGMWKDGKVSQLEDIERWIETIVDNRPELYLHLSLLKVLLEKESLSTYHQYCEKVLHLPPDNEVYAVIPGLQFCKKKQRKHNPWKAIIPHVNKMKLMPVMWRTQLQFMHCVKDKRAIREADICGKHLNFRISNHGYLTGDLQQILPSVKLIELDLYTGQQVFVASSDSPVTWLYDDTCFTKCSNNMYNPTMNEIYRHEGNVVRLVTLSSGSCSNLPLAPEGVSDLYWTGNDGQTAHLNLLRFIKIQWKKTILEDIENMKGTARIRSRFMPSSIDEDTVHKMKTCLNLLYDRDLLFNLHTIDDVKKKLYPKYHKKSSKKKIKPVKRSEVLSKKQLFPNRIVDYKRYGHTLLIIVKVDNTNQYYPIFVDCSTRESFLHPTMDFSDFVCLDVHCSVTSCKNHVVERSDIIWIVSSNFQYHGRKVKVYGQGGQFLTQIDYSGRSADPNIPVILGSDIFQIDLSSKNVVKKICTDIITDGKCKVAETKEFSSIVNLYSFADKLLLHLEDKIVILHPKTLKSLNIHVTCTS